MPLSQQYALGVIGWRKNMANMTRVSMPLSQQYALGEAELAEKTLEIVVSMPLSQQYALGVRCKTH